ncbi:MAG: homoserine kinase [Planctomycetes bacterium]|nr:homoserine kinase [Planctomycetota bacterium]
MIDTPGRAEGWVSVFAPASVSNVGPGFDAFGFAIEAIGDTVHARLRSEPGVRIVSITGDGGALPREAERNTASVAAASMLRRFSAPPETPGLEIAVDKGLPLCSGLGSSAASAVAGAVAAMHLVGAGREVDVTSPEVFEAALDGEMVAAGGRHADNVAPSLLGGFVIVRGVDPPRWARFEPALRCHVAVVTPQIEISTRAAREALPESVSLADAVRNWSNAATLVLGLVQGDRDLVADALVDAVVEPHRAKLIPGAEAARAAAREAGAFAGGVSGSGPTMFALAENEMAAAAAAAAMAEVFAGEGLASVSTTTTICPEGARER